MEGEETAGLKTIKMEVDSDSEEKKTILPTICPESSSESSNTEVKEDSKVDESSSDVKKDSEGRRSAEPERKDIIQLSVEGVTEDENEKIIFMSGENKMSTTLPKRFSSDLWNHFTKLDKKGKCRYCQRMIATPSGSTSNLKRHLKSKHPAVTLERSGSGSWLRSPLASDDNESEILSVESPSCDSILTWVEVSGSDMQSQSSPSSLPGPSVFESGPSSSFVTPSPPIIFQQPISKHVNVVKPMTLNNRTAFDRQLLKMICKGYHPFSIVEDQEFKKFIHMLCPNYNLPCRKTLSNSLLPSVHNELFDKIKSDLIGTKTVCLSSEGWTSINNVCFYSLTAHFINDKTQLKSHLLECSQFEEGHTVENISAWVKSVTTKYNIDHKITAIITDNASDMKSAAMHLNLQHIPCFAHSLNLVAQHAIQLSVQKIVEEVKKTVMYFKKNSFALSKLEEIQENLDKEKLKLIQEVPTRWNSTYDMIQRFFLNKESIISCLSVLGSESFSLNLTDADWEVIEQSIQILKVFNEVTKELSSEKIVSLSKMGVLLRLMTSHLRASKEKNKNCPPQIDSLVNELLKGLAERFGVISNDELVTQATLLDPRFKKQGFIEESKFWECYYSTTLVMKKLFVQDMPNQTPQKDPDSSISSGDSSIWEEFDKTINLLQGTHDPGSAAVIELDNYLSEAYLSRNSNPLIWWDSRKLLYPTLYKLVLKRLCVPATSVPCERIFSKAGQICTEKRNRLTSNKITQILFLSDNMD